MKLCAPGGNTQRKQGTELQEVVGPHKRTETEDLQKVDNPITRFSPETKMTLYSSKRKGEEDGAADWGRKGEKKKFHDSQDRSMSGFRRGGCGWGGKKG